MNSRERTQLLRPGAASLSQWLRRWPCEYWFGLASLVFSLPLAIPPFRSLDSYAGWTPGYYYINYWEFGFVKRGLLGTVFTLTGLNRMVAPTLFTCIVHILGLLAFSLFFWLLAHRCSRDLNTADRRRKPWLYAVFLTSPALFLHFGFDLGRVDLFGLNITLLALLMLLADLPWRVKILTTLLVTVVGLLTHEAYLFFWSPLLVLGILEGLRGEPARCRWLALLGWGAVVLGVLISLRLWGAFEPGAGELARRFTAIHPSLATSLQAELTSDLLQDNITPALSSFSPANWVGHNPVLALYVGIIMVGFVRFLFATRNPTTPLTAAAVLAPLLMSLLAADHVRFLSCSLTAAAVALLLLMRSQRHIPPWLSPPLAWLPLPFVLLGPMGIVAGDPLPLLRYL